MDIAANDGITLGDEGLLSELFSFPRNRWLLYIAVVLACALAAFIAVMAAK